MAVLRRLFSLTHLLFTRSNFHYQSESGVSRARAKKDVIIYVTETKAIAKFLILNIEYLFLEYNMHEL